MKPKLKKQNYSGFKHKVAIKALSADKFINYMSITNTYGRKQVCAVYYSSNPDLSKGHKPYPMLTNSNGQVFILGRELHELKKDSIHFGVLCTNCNTILVSLDRHNFHGCGCSAETFIDGGQEYFRCVSSDIAKTVMVKVDMLNNKFKRMK